jgi:cell filamentation protein
MDRAEAETQVAALEKLIRMYDRDHRFKSSDVCAIHEVWLGDIYEWAGKYRNVNVSRDDFHFAAAVQVPGLMSELQKGVLKRFTPCRYDAEEDVITALAEVHTELVLIHPFRDGNGRAARLLAILMALQAGLPILDFTGIRGRKRKEYFSAVRVGMDRDYAPMEKIFRSVVRRTLRLRK